MNAKEQEIAKKLQGGLIEGTESLANWHKDKAENCIARHGGATGIPNSGDMEGFSECLLPYHKNYTKVTELFQQKVNYIQITMDECIKTHGKSEMSTCMNKALERVSDSVSGSMYE